MPKWNTIKIPGKVFLIGEYAVMYGAPAIVLGTAPFFEWRIEEQLKNLKKFHPDSPAGAYQLNQLKLNSEPFVGNFLDPYRGAGGFGASTAQFLSLWILSQLRDGYSVTQESYVSAWKAYREIVGELASGADLVGQFLGGVHFVQLMGLSEVHAKPIQSSDYSQGFQGFKDVRVFVFSATHQENRKVRTHEHLKNFILSDQHQNELKDFLNKLQLELLPKESLLNEWHFGKILGQSMVSYADLLHSFNLELPQAHIERKKFCEIEGVLGAKGAGAHLADAIVVLGYGFAAREIYRTAENLNLRLVYNQLLDEPVPGVTFTNEGEF